MVESGHEKPGQRRSVAASALVGCVWLYRGTLGRLLGGQCRFDPSCSQYAIDAIGKYGAMRGAWRTIKRIGRCHPLSKGGWDPA
jgi:putative membrane protein insertion efficiency factor